ncbi:hypothetical protein V6N13_053896 [Hibiscus sabdariffa]|uniref:5'-3' DNA helicase ZGRF1-like N-terminal domain-containing protein n=1 Tax=Hibiscus sabdariffa TaxID=183260 RepID=A0ABR2T6R8_9ROSI
MLYDESKKQINSRFLKKDEVIQSGESIVFDAHLVNIGEAEGNHPDLTNSDARVSNCNVAGKTEMIHRVQHCLKTNKSFLKGKSQKIASSMVNADPTLSIPSIAETKSSQNKSAHKPFRDATQILSILRKPMIQESIATQSINKNIMNPVSLVKEPHDWDSTKNILECSQLPRMSIAHHGSSGKLDNIKSSECTDIKISPDISSKGKFKAHSEDLESYTTCRNEAPVLSSTSRGVHTSQRVDVRKDCSEVENSREAGSCPSFELGFD